jgi:hypothetical protein
MKKGYKILIIVLVVLVIVIIGVRIYLPYYVRDKINRELKTLDNLHGRLDRVTMQLFRGSIQLHDMVLYNKQSADPLLPFVIIGHNDISIEWRKLIKGKVVVEVIIDTLVVNFTRPEEEVEEKDLINLKEILEDIVPFSVNVFRISNGRISFVDVNVSPYLEVYLADLFLEVNNIQNVDELADSLPSRLRLESRIMNTGSLIVDAAFNLLIDKVPNFEYSIEVEDADLTEFNDYLKQNASFTINEGLLNVYSEGAARDGLLAGYVKPLIDELEILPVEKEDASQLRKLWESLLELVTNVLENPKTDMIGTEVTFEGRIDDPEVDMWQSIWLLMRNAFFESINKGLDDRINFDDLSAGSKRQKGEKR